MGNSQSSAADRQSQAEVEKILVQQLQNLRTGRGIRQREVDDDYLQVDTEKGIPHTYSTDPTLSVKTAEAWEKELLSDPKN